MFDQVVLLCCTTFFFKNDNTIIITNKQTEKSTQLELYQKIKVKMIGIIDNISIRNKLIVKILEPDLNVIM